MRKIICILFLCPLFFVTCYAAEPELAEAAMSEFYEMEHALPREELEISGELKLDGSYDTKGAMQRLWERFQEELRSRLQQDLHFGVQLFAVAVFCSLTTAFVTSREMEDVINLAGCSTVSVFLAGDLDGMISQASQTLVQLSDYSRAAMPALFAAAAASGAPASASVRYAAASMAIDGIIGVAGRFILPLIHGFVAVAICRSIYENAALNAALKLLKWCATTAMTVMTMAFTAYLSISGLISGSTDALAVKAAKTVISRALPVVGGILSDSASVVLAAAAVIKNSAGVFSLIAVCALCLGPFVALSVKMLIFKGAAAAADLLPGNRLSQLIGDIGTAFGMLLGMIGSCGIMLFISIMSGIRVVSG